MPGKVAGEGREMELFKPAALSTTNKIEETSDRVSGKYGDPSQSWLLAAKPLTEGD